MPPGVQQRRSHLAPCPHPAGGLTSAAAPPPCLLCLQGAPYCGARSGQRAAVKRSELPAQEGDGRRAPIARAGPRLEFRSGLVPAGMTGHAGHTTQPSRDPDAPCALPAACRRSGRGAEACRVRLEACNPPGGRGVAAGAGTPRAEVVELGLQLFDRQSALAPTKPSLHETQAAEATLQLGAQQQQSVLPLPEGLPRRCSAVAATQRACRHLGAALCCTRRPLSRRRRRGCGRPCRRARRGRRVGRPRQGGSPSQASCQAPWAPSSEGGSQGGAIQAGVSRCRP